MFVRLQHLGLVNAGSSVVGKFSRNQIIVLNSKEYLKSVAKKTIYQTRCTLRFTEVRLGLLQISEEPPDGITVFNLKQYYVIPECVINFKKKTLRVVKCLKCTSEIKLH